MYQTINFSQFCDAFRAHDRQDQFSYEAKRIIFDWLEQLEEDTGGIELDVIAICCEWAEMDYDDVIAAYNLDSEIDDFAEMDECEQHEAVEQYLQDQTIVAGATTDGTIIFVQF